VGGDGAEFVGRILGAGGGAEVVHDVNDVKVGQTVAAGAPNANDKGVARVVHRAHGMTPDDHTAPVLLGPIQPQERVQARSSPRSRCHSHLWWKWRRRHWPQEHAPPWTRLRSRCRCRLPSWHSKVRGLEAERSDLRAQDL
jgi:hypothetical protein